MVLDGLGVHPDDADLRIVVGSGVDERFVNGFIGVLQLDVFPGDGDGDLVLGMDNALDEAFPILKRR
jgi:hypothetical protein